jgi:MraZ protein
VEARRVRYNGQGFSLRGEKDRFVLPPDFRKALKESGEGRKELCLQLHADLPCLVAFGLSREHELDAQLDREEDNALRRGEPFDRQLRSSQLFGFLKVPFDDSGRFVLPPRFVKGASIAEQLYFQGAGADFLIFNPDELAKLGDDWRHAKLACEDLAQQAAAARGRKV